MNENIIRTISSEMNRYLNNYQMSKLQEVLYKKVEQVKHLLGHTKIDTTLHYAFVNQNNVKNIS